MVPRVVAARGRHVRPRATTRRSRSGALRGFQGNYGTFVRAYAYVCSLGAAGLKDVSEAAVLNANYLLARLSEEGVAEYLPRAYGELCMHEFVLSGAPLKRELKIRTLDLAKRLLDFGFHPPTVYFPLLVEEALMVEPTETETKETLDDFAAAIAEILREAAEDPRDRARGAATRRRCDASTRSRRRSSRSCARPFEHGAAAHLLGHPADRTQAPGQLHRRDPPVHRKPGARRGRCSASSTSTRPRSPTTRSS